MADQEKDKRMQIDDMLDSLLANYSSAEARPGLETRILASLREARKESVARMVEVQLDLGRSGDRRIGDCWCAGEWPASSNIADNTVVVNQTACSATTNSAARAGCSTDIGQSPSAQTIGGPTSPAECSAGIK